MRIFTQDTHFYVYFPCCMEVGTKSHGRHPGYARIRGSRKDMVIRKPQRRRGPPLEIIAIDDDDDRDVDNEEYTKISHEFLEALLPRSEKSYFSKKHRNNDVIVVKLPVRTKTNPASFFSSLDPALQQDEEIFAQLPDKITAKARALPSRFIVSLYAPSVII